jgi:putative ABC transport system ATP-binding protein
VTSIPLVSLRGLNKSYVEGRSERVVLQSIDARFERGEFIVLLGKSGSGKSTLLNILGGIDRPSGGEIEILGRPLAHMSEEGRTLFRRVHIGFIFQTFNLIPTLTVEENLLLPLELRGPRREAGDDAGAGSRAGSGAGARAGVRRRSQTRARDRAQARALLTELGLDSRRDSFPDVLSGGEQQRVAVARALIHEPALVLADEPTGNLDERTGRDVLELIHRLTRARAGTVLVVTHDRDLMNRADRVFVLEEGRLSELRAPPEPHPPAPSPT